MSQIPEEFSPQWRSLRRSILKRDGYRCSVFGCDVKGSKNLSVHHIVPRPEGSDNPANLIALCNRHHNEIELARVPTANLIRNWTGPDMTARESTILSGEILDAISGDEHTDMTSDIAASESGYVCRSSTEAALVAIKDRRSLVDLANILHYEPSFATTISAIISGRAGAITEEGEHELRVRLGLESESGDIPSERCSKCGHRHFADTPCLTFAFGTAPTVQVKRKRNGNENNRRERHLVDDETVEALQKFASGKSWRACADALEYAPGYGATLWSVAHKKPGAMTPIAENVLRERLGLAPRHYVTVAPCPDCGSAHTGRCHGKPVARVVIVSGKPRNRKKYHRPCLDDAEYARFLEWRASL